MINIHDGCDPLVDGYGNTKGTVYLIVDKIYYDANSVSVVLDLAYGV